MNYWLLKTEPSDYSFDDLAGEVAGTVWDGVGNYAALKHLRDIQEGDQAFIYHTGRERSIVGIAKVTSDPYPDPQQDDERMMVVEVAAERSLERPVPLAELRDEPVFAEFDLVTNPRLSVMPVRREYWDRIVQRAASAASDGA